MNSQKQKEIIRKFGIDIEQLKKEQIKLSKELVLRDQIKSDDVEFIGAFSNLAVRNKVISVIVVMDKDLEIVEQKYFTEKAEFPYLFGFRAYRELPAMLSCFSKIEHKPDIVFIDGLGINHPRLGLSSHFSISSGVPSIAITDKKIGFEVDKNNIVSGKHDEIKTVGKVVHTKKGSKPLFVSPGSLVSVETAAEITKRFVRTPHKMPEPLRAAKKYAKKIRKELFGI